MNLFTHAELRSHWDHEVPATVFSMQDIEEFCEEIGPEEEVVLVTVRPSIPMFVRELERLSREEVSLEQQIDYIEAYERMPLERSK